MNYKKIEKTRFLKFVGKQRQTTHDPGNMYYCPICGAEDEFFKMYDNGSSNMTNRSYHCLCCGYERLRRFQYGDNWKNYFSDDFLYPLAGCTKGDLLYELKYDGQPGVKLYATNDTFKVDELGNIIQDKDSEGYKEPYGNVTEYPVYSFFLEQYWPMKGVTHEQAFVLTGEILWKSNSVRLTVFTYKRQFEVSLGSITIPLEEADALFKKMKIFKTNENFEYESLMDLREMLLEDGECDY